MSGSHADGGVTPYLGAAKLLIVSRPQNVVLHIY